MNRRTLILSALGLGVAGFGGAAWYATRPTATASATGTTKATAATQSAPSLSPEQTEALMRPYSPTFGPDDAPVTIVEFLDPACEACRAFHPIVKDIMAEHGDAVHVVIRYTPFHGESSEQAVRVLEAARMQGVYIEVMDALFAQQSSWASRGKPPEGKIMEIAGRAGLDVAAASTQIMMPDLVGILNQDKADVETLNVRQTPTFFVNGRPLDPFGEAELRRLVASEVAAAQS